MLVLGSVWNAACTLFQYDHASVATDELGLWVDLTSRGLERYVTFNTDYVMEYLQDAVFPDIALEIIGFKLSLVDLKLGNVGFTDVELVFGEGGADLRVRSFRLAFEYRFVLQ